MALTSDSIYALWYVIFVSSVDQLLICLFQFWKTFSISIRPLQPPMFVYTPGTSVVTLFMWLCSLNSSLPSSGRKLGLVLQFSNKSSKNLTFLLLFFSPIFSSQFPSLIPSPSLVNTYGSFTGFIVGLTLRLGGGEPTFDLEPFIHYKPVDDDGGRGYHKPACHL